MKLLLVVVLRPVLVPAAFRRLCVETYEFVVFGFLKDPAAFRRLCVETAPYTPQGSNTPPSRLQAAVC